MAVDPVATASTVMNYIMVIIVLVAVGLGAWFLINLKKYNIKVRIHEKTRRGTLVIDDVAKEFTPAGSNEILYQLKKSKQNMPLPDASCISVDTKGRRVLELFKFPDGTFDFMRIDAKQNLIESFPSDEKAFLVHQFRQADDRRRSSFLEKHGAALVFGGIMITILVITFAFWEEINEPMIQATGKWEATSANMVEATRLMNEMILKKQIFVSNDPKKEAPN